MSGPLAGKRALITGSSHGVGLAAAHLFASQGAEVVLHGNQNMVDADAAVQEIGPRALGAVEANLLMPGAGRELYDTALHLAGGRIDIVVNNAGIHWDTPHRRQRRNLGGQLGRPVAGQSPWPWPIFAGLQSPK